MDHPEAVAEALGKARAAYREEPDRALAEAIRCDDAAVTLGEFGLGARALVLQGHVSLHRGDVRGGLALAADAAQLAANSDDVVALAELATLRAQVDLFTGSYADAVAQAERAIELADTTGDLDLRIFARRAAFLVFGQISAERLRDRLGELLDLCVEAGDLWEQAISHNDIACYLEEQGDIEGARREIDRALDLALQTSPNKFALAVIYSTRADIDLTAGEAYSALENAELSLSMLNTATEPNPYVVGATVRAQVRARMALGQLDGAQASGRNALDWLGDRMPRTRGLILRTVASALREAGRVEEAYDALWESAELEREAFRELSQMQANLQRATLQARLAQSETGVLRDQAERDWLTGLYNRRYLAREFADRTPGRFGGLLSVAVVDLDHFKDVNDRFGHAIGDQVLVRAAGVLTHSTRASDIVVRSGGEEFLVLMPLTDADDALHCCERIREAIAAEPWGQIASGMTLTTSVGVATAQYWVDLEALVGVADKCLYAAKNAGRDRVVASA